MGLYGISTLCFLILTNTVEIDCTNQIFKPKVELYNKEKEVTHGSANYEIKEQKNHVEYWKLLLQGTCKAKCLNLSLSVPKLDDDNEIFTTEAACENNSCRQCLQCIEEGDTQTCKAWLDPYCYNKMELEYKIRDRDLISSPDLMTLPSSLYPIFHCSSYQKNTSSFDAYFRIEYPQHNDTLSNLTRDSPDTIPRSFVIEMLSEETDGKYKVEQIFLTTSWLISVNVAANMSFAVRVTPLSPKFIHLPVTTQPIIIFETKDRGTRHPPKDIKIQRIRQNPSVTTHPDLEVLLHWKSGLGTQATCSSKIWILITGDESFDFTQAKNSFWFHLTNETMLGMNLKFGSDQSIQIQEMSDIDPEYGSNITEFTIRLPPCLQLFNQSFIMCPPPPPQDLDFQILSNNSILATWNPPLHTSENNSIDSYEIRLIKFSPHYLSKGVPANAIPHHTLLCNVTIPGNMNSFLFKNYSHSGIIQVMIKSVTKGGSSIFVMKGPNAPVDRTDSVLQKLLIAGIVIVGVIALVCFGCLLKIRKDKRNRHEARAKYCGDDKEVACKIESLYFPPYCSKWLIDTSCLKIGELIGEGYFGQVHAATLYKLDSSRIVAVKTLKEGVNLGERSKFWEEFRILKNLEPHPHVVRLIGIVKASYPTIVVEYCDGGDLHTYLRKLRDEKAKRIAREKRQLKWMSSGTISGEFLRNAVSSNGSLNLTSSNRLMEDEPDVRLSMVTNEAYFARMNDDEIGAKESIEPFEFNRFVSFGRQVAAGMEFLSNNKIVHRDLAARNILVIHEQKPILKIADFGLSRDVYENNWYKKNSDDKIPFKWLALECLLDEVYTTKSDVWSYGVLLWEIVTYGGSPYPGIKNMDIFELLKQGNRMSQPENCPRELYKIMRKCWEKESEDRPDFGTIRRLLDGMVEKSLNLEYFQLQQENESRESCSSNEDKENIHYEEGLIFSKQNSIEHYEIPIRSTSSNAEEKVCYSTLSPINSPADTVVSTQQTSFIDKEKEGTFPIFHNPILNYSENVLYTSLDPNSINNDHIPLSRKYSSTASLFEIRIPYNNGEGRGSDYENELYRININEKQEDESPTNQPNHFNLEKRSSSESSASTHDPQDLLSSGNKRKIIGMSKFFTTNSSTSSFKLVTGYRWNKSGGNNNSKKNNKYPSTVLV